MMRDLLRRAALWSNPYTWPEPKTAKGLMAQIIGASLIMPFGILIVMYLGTPGR